MIIERSAFIFSHFGSGKCRAIKNDFSQSDARSRSAGFADKSTWIVDAERDDLTM